MSTAAQTQRRGTRPRADALRNRERIVTAAREMFVELGAEVALDEVARRAGLGNATIYRHFPDRSALMHAVFLEVMGNVEGLARQLLAETDDAAATAARNGTDEAPGGADAFGALRRFAHGAAGERIGALCSLRFTDFDQNHPDLVAARARINADVEALMERARAAGQLRTDVTVGDLLVALAHLSRPLPGTVCLDLDAYFRRHLEIFLDGLRAPGHSELPGAPASLGAPPGA
ncbi:MULTISPECIES: TetR/AcrR family transcriptional regulator [Streptomyces]|uniref:TetR family transcriptional regulator n=1 Tax=Streptomyces albus (strain ATCC 21838 / DSM 41398 / FERM P-419 / JCM 4703 / NBRC 107858) TaxID=1081613 RepID=A0A0B5EZF6_STRA4|nr:TetR/AcrR family transcriptional regulator [Streptomyces sp. SCSIO ZS0520]AJE84740.1 TetR family transcriptional regulator [Streptomyces albus]AOU79045.1 TetR family transcriptional regulator [Streptomyces albus]AYN34780.1 TetR/AcrR family transcriptional regulator [Streptomyces albus]